MQAQASELVAPRMSQRITMKIKIGITQVKEGRFMADEEQGYVYLIEQRHSCLYFRIPTVQL